MVGEASVSNAVDPLSGLNGPSFFPRTIRAAANDPLPSNLKDLDSIHSFMKSLNVPRSPQKLMNEAKKIVDHGAELLESNLVGFNENESMTNAIAAKGKDKPRDRRPALGLGRKRAPFSLKARFSQPSANLEPTFDIDQLEDPDEFFDVYERNENAKKEIQKQLGGNMDNINLYEPSKKERVRRPGILGKTYKYKHRFSSTPAKTDEMWMSTQETVSQDIPSAHNDSSQEKLVHPDPNPDTDLEEAEPASTKKTASDVNNILEELLSCNMEDLEGHGALNLLQERLKIMPLDIENLGMTELPDAGRTSILIASENRKKPRKSSVDIDSVLKNWSRKRHTEQEPGENPIDPVSSSTPPRSPLGYISLLQKRILQPRIDPFSPLNVDLSSRPNDPVSSPTPPRSPLGYISLLQKRILQPRIDPFSPLNVDLSSRPNASPSQYKDKIIGEVDAHQDMRMSGELESHIELCNPEPPDSDMYAEELMENADSRPDQFVDESASIQRANTNSKPNASPVYPKDKLLDQVEASPSQHKDKIVGEVDAHQDMRMSGELESHIELCNPEPPDSDMYAEEVMENADSRPEQFVDESASIQRANTNSKPNASPVYPKDKLLEQVEAPKDLGMSSELESHVEVGNTEPAVSNMDAQEVVGDEDSLPEQSVDENVSMQRNADIWPNEESDNNTGKQMNVNVADESNPPVFEEEARVDTASRRQIDAEQQFEVPTAKPHRGKRDAGGKRSRNAHPMRKSLAEAGTTFENGLRRSKRIRSRPLEFWKGERFVFGRVGNSVKLIGVKCFSPGEGTEKLKVKPFISLETPTDKEILELAGRH